MPHPVTQSELADLIRPFVGTFRQVHRQGLSRIDIRHRTNSVDADVREVSEEGIKLFFYDRCELVPWSAVKSLTIAGPHSEIVFEHKDDCDREAGRIAA